MPNIFFTSDTHFFHKSILKNTDRHYLWSSIEEMNEGLIKRWNNKVNHKDHVYHLGDVLWHPNNNAKILDRLNGNITLISGNHDGNQTKRLRRFRDVYDFCEIKIDNTYITLLHYKMETWNKCHYGSLHFFGHSHGKLKGNSQCCDVGVDNPVWDYSPANIEEIKEFLKTQPKKKKELT